MESGASAKVTHDIVIDNQVAFKAGETVMVEAVSPNEQRPEYKYVVTSPGLGKKFSLSDADLSELPPGAAATAPSGRGDGHVQAPGEEAGAPAGGIEVIR